MQSGENQRGDNVTLTVTYSVNGKSIDYEELKNIQITRKDYIDYVEELKRNVNNKERLKRWKL